MLGVNVETSKDVNTQTKTINVDAFSVRAFTAENNYIYYNISMFTDKHGIFRFGILPYSFYHTTILPYYHSTILSQTNINVLLFS